MPGSKSVSSGDKVPSRPGTRSPDDDKPPSATQPPSNQPPPSSHLSTTRFILPRDKYRPSASKRINKSVATVTKYLRDTGIEDNFKTLLGLLLGLSDLPYNPYPGFARRFRVFVEKFHMEQTSEDDIRKLLTCKVSAADVAYIHHPFHCDYVWGLEGIVEMAEPRSLKQFLYLLELLSIEQMRSRDRRDGYSKQAMLALVGPAVFDGPLYTASSTVQIRVEYLITGPQASEAISIFISALIEDVIRTEKSDEQILLGVEVPRQSPAEPDAWSYEFWKYERILHQKDVFRHLVSQAVTANQYVNCEVVFRMDSDGLSYRRGQKQYALNYIQVSENGQDQGLSYFTEFPLITLHEGIFMTQPHAESYLSTFTPKIDLLNKKSEDKAASSKSSAKRSSAKSNKSDKAATPPAGKIRLDGFVLGDRSGYTPDAWQITGPIKSSWQRKIASLVPETELFEVIHYILLLVLMDKESYDSRLMVEIYYLSHSTPARLYALMNLNKTIREVIIKYEGESDLELVTKLFLKYKVGLVELFDNPLREGSSDQVTCIRAVTQMLDDIIMTDGPKYRGVPLVKKNVEILKNLNSYTFTLLIGLIEDVMDQCPVLTEVIKLFKTNFPDDVPRPKTGVRTKTGKTQIGLDRNKQEDDYKHGLEDENITNQERQTVNVELCMQKDNAPKIISVESVLIKYITDTHLDKVWPDFLLDLVTGENLPPDPYARLVTALRQAALRMELHFEAPDKLSSRILHSTMRLEDPGNYIYHLPGCDAHGLQTAMTLLDSGTFFELAPIVAKFIQKEFKMRHGPYRIAICCAVSGFTTLYGKVDPYLREIELHEHCFARGPEGCWAEAVQLYSKIVYEHVRELYNQKTTFLVGLFMGDKGNMWRIEEVLNRKKGFAHEFERHCGLRQQLYIKLYVEMGWRLVPVIKFLKFHFINDEETRYDLLFPENPAHLYQNVFLDKDRAAFHFQYGGPPDGSSPYNTTNVRNVNSTISELILDARNHQDWLNVHRWLLLRNVISQGSSLVAEAWQILHSTAGQIEYVNSLARSLQDLIHYAIDLEIRGSTEHTYYNVTSSQDEEDIVVKLESSLGQLVNAYRQKVAAICRSPTSMMPKTFLAVVENKLQSITEKDPTTDDVYMDISIKSVFVLDEVIHMMRAVQDAVAYDVHSICAESGAMLRSIQAESPQRPDSVASIHLEDHHQYQQRPAAKISDHIMEWAAF